MTGDVVYFYAFDVANEIVPGRIGTILGELASVRPFKEVEISPDGKQIAWVQELIENRKDTGNSAIYITDFRGGSAPVRISSARPASERNLAWSHDSSRVAFLSDRDKKGQMQLYVAPAQRHDPIGGSPPWVPATGNRREPVPLQEVCCSHIQVGARQT